MGAKASTDARSRVPGASSIETSLPNNVSLPSRNNTITHDAHHEGRHSSNGRRSRTRSLAENFHDNTSVLFSNGSSSLDSDDSTPEDRPRSRSLIGATMPFSLYDLKCPVCNKMVKSVDIEVHLVMCFTKPRINYNEDVLTEDKGECVICFDEMKKGDVIARLPCLCIYHKACIDKWFHVNRCCPEHPGE